MTGGGKLNYIVYRSYKEDSVIEYENAEETLNYPVGDKTLGDIITQAKVWERTLSLKYQQQRAEVNLLLPFVFDYVLI